MIFLQVKETEPLYFKTLEANCPNELWRFVRDRVDQFQHTERDKVREKNAYINSKISFAWWNSGNSQMIAINTRRMFFNIAENNFRWEEHTYINFILIPLTFSLYFCHLLKSVLLILGRRHGHFPSIEEWEICRIHGKHDQTQKWTQFNGAKSGLFHFCWQFCNSTKFIPM